MNIYLAARYARREEINSYAAELRDDGHIITSRWLEGGHEAETYELKSGKTLSKTGWKFAIEDLQDLERADCLISFTESPDSPYGRGGRHVEFGWALATTKRVIIVGPRENVFHCLNRVEHYYNWGPRIRHELLGAGR